ncbi:MAG: methionine adenosyltransferase [Candidatus Tectomicrobia bacterium]|nr:methionine adenosyltransferase [Candidatus Tectomicrobia bacterium]
MSRSYLFTSESVSEGHPDKVADQISDGVLDAIIAKDPVARVACETLITTGMVLVAGEITTTATIDVQKVVRNTVREIGYTDPAYGFDCNSCAVLVALDEQSPDISMGVTEGVGLHKEAGAGDQGLMFGYATNETPELMPLPIMVAHRLVKKLSELRKNGTLEYLRPDAKSQVTIEYRDSVPVKLHTIVLSAQHAPEVTLDVIREDLRNMVIMPTVPKQLLDTDNYKLYVNPTGRFVNGGPQADCGLTGRKIIVDTYGGYGRHGGGAFSGKDPTKVDRSASYMARYVAKNIVAAGLADRCEVQIAYAIGLAEPVSLYVDTFGTGKVDHELIERLVRQIFPLKPAEIIQTLNLRRAIFRKTAAYGHFGREEPEFTWERTDRAEELRRAAGL